MGNGPTAELVGEEGDGGGDVGGTAGEVADVGCPVLVVPVGDGDGERGQGVKCCRTDAVGWVQLRRDSLEAPEAAVVEHLQALQLVRVEGPGLAGVEQDREDEGVVELELGVWGEGGRAPEASVAQAE